MIEKLAQDMEEIVSCPILEFSPLLSKHSLLEIVASGISSGALQAVSKRKNLDLDVSDAVYESGDKDAVGTLLENKTANIKAKTMDKIADEAETNTSWHPPMVQRDDLTPKTIRRIATFVSRSLLDTLIKRNNVNEKLVEDVRKVVRKRIERGDIQEIQRTCQPEKPGQKSYLMPENLMKMQSSALFKTANLHLFITH